MYDITNHPTFLNVPEWIDNTRKYIFANIQVVLVGNKMDCKDHEASTKEGCKLAGMHRVRFYITSTNTPTAADAVNDTLS